MKKNNSLGLYAVIGMLTTTVVLAFARLSYGVVLPFMKDGLDISYQQAGYLGTTTSLGYLSTVVFAGILATKWGGKRTVILGISLVTGGFIGLALAPFYWMMYIFMLFLGVGTAFTYTPFISLLVARFPQKKGLMIGLATSGVGIGMLFAGIVVPYLGNIYGDMGWRLTWGIYAAVGFVVVLLTLRFIEHTPNETESVNKVQNTSPKEIYTNPNVMVVGFIYGIIGIAYIVQVIFVMSFMIESGVSNKIAGQLMAVNGILSIFSGFIWGAISDKLGRRFSLISTMGLVLLSMLVPVFFPTLFGFTIHIIVISCTITGLFTLIQASSMDHVEAKDMPVAFGYVTFYFAAGQLIGPTIAGWLIDGFGGFKTAFLFCAICLGVGFALTLKVKNSEEVQQVDTPITIES
ncbi:MFS transporter [Mesobacillus maritimus]|uniref:MFS transporter n=1 Tax=Mesobacillus maritimus TaxID=1643336 RepID=UPI00384A9CD9